MYKELAEFARHIVRQKSVWLDGELWTAVAGAALSAACFYKQPELTQRVREHFSELLSVASIVFGFAVTAMVFYVEAANSWSRDPRVRSVAEKLVDWHVLTVLSLLALIGYTLVLWALADKIVTGPRSAAAAYSALVFLMLYSCFQIVNHVLTVRWAFRRSADLDQKQSN